MSTQMGGEERTDHSLPGLHGQSDMTGGAEEEEEEQEKEEEEDTGGRGGNERG